MPPSKAASAFETSYSRMGDDELLHLVTQKDSLGDAARQALAVELGRRRMTFVAPTVAEAILGAEPPLRPRRTSNVSFGRRPVSLENSKTNISKTSFRSLYMFFSIVVTAKRLRPFLTRKNVAPFWILSLAAFSNSERPGA
jgi:hypothetical protein